MIPYEEDDIAPTDESMDDDMLFMRGESIRFNDGAGDSDLGHYHGPQLHEGAIKHKITRSDGVDYLVDRENIHAPEMPTISQVPKSPEQYAALLPDLTMDDLAQIARPEPLDAEQKEFTDLHCKMNHTPFAEMMRLAEAGEIPKKFLKLKGRLPVCISCAFGKAHRKLWQSKGKPGSIRKDDDNIPGKCVSVDHLPSHENAVAGARAIGVGGAGAEEACACEIGHIYDHEAAGEKQKSKG